MSSPALTIEADQAVGRAARLMIEKDVNRLPVVEGGELVGIVTRADLVRAFIRSDAEIAAEIRDDVIVRNLGLDEHSVQVEVEDGEVSLTTREEAADVRSLEALVSSVPGVVGVHSESA
jgi:CBS domain-containing protein